MDRMHIGVIAVLLVCIIGILASCGPDHVASPGQQVVTRDVLISVRAPCPDEKDIPAVPKSVHEEHPVMPEAKDKAAIDQVLGAAAARERILAGKVLEYRTYAERADGIMRACAKPATPAP
jgi:hypothetical protein